MCMCYHPTRDDKEWRATYLFAFVVFREHMAPYLIACIAFVTAKSAAGKTATPTEAKIINACAKFGYD